MERTITLLNEKNHYLEKFYSLNETELPQFREGNFENLEKFYRTREQILEVIKYIDAQMMNESQIDAEMQNCTETHKRTLRECMAIKDEYVSRIIHQDMELLSCIEGAKNMIIRELQDLRKAKKAVSGYKAPTFDKSLDEEA